MIHKREGFVLGEHRHTGEIRIGGVGKGKVDYAINASKGHSGLGPFADQNV
jgi:hypothetical protein